MEKICPNCGASMPEASKFCTECGSPFPAPQPKPEPKKEEPRKPEPQPREPEPDPAGDPMAATRPLDLPGTDPVKPQQPQPNPQPQPKPIGTYNPAAQNAPAQQAQPTQQAQPPKPTGTYDPATGTIQQTQKTQQAQQAQQAQQPIGTYNPAAQQGSYQPQAAAADYSDVPGPESPYQPVSSWGWFGSLLLLSIPIVGIIITIVWACGGCRKVNKRNYCRALLLNMVITLAILGIIGGIGYSVLTKVLNDPATQEALAGLLGGAMGM